MVDIDEETGLRILRRSATYHPPGFWRKWLVGRPLPTADAAHQTIGKAIGLAVFASDALSSTAYATQEILLILAVAGTLAFGYAFPIALAIVALLAIVTVSYEQTIQAYPNGGGAYIVARDNLGEWAAQAAGAALLVDYMRALSSLPGEPTGRGGWLAAVLLANVSHTHGSVAKGGPYGPATVHPHHAVTPPRLPR